MAQNYCSYKHHAVFIIMNWMEKLLNTGSHLYHMSTHTHIHTYLSTLTYMYTQKTHTLFSLNLFIQDGNLHRAGKREEGVGWLYPHLSQGTN